MDVKAMLGRKQHCCICKEGGSLCVYMLCLCTVCMLEAHILEAQDNIGCAKGEGTFGINE